MSTIEVILYGGILALAVILFLYPNYETKD